MGNNYTYKYKITTLFAQIKAICIFVGHDEIFDRQHPFYKLI